ncbi:MAG: SGNH/GDSL hydrolase family protein [Nannocystis sp.]|nr:hypothetical protein [Nannocystis sp.]MBA3547943.1 SGNH/GDSL hydrolase family protein [Nannocystis sp.]
MRHLLYIVPILLALWFVDQCLSRDRRVGWERNAMRGYEWRWTKADGRKVLLLGSSTAVDWLPPSYLAPLLRVDRDLLLDAHVNGCHQDCAWAIVRRAVQEQRRFELSVIGVNQFQQCDDLHPKRSLQLHTLMPTRDLPRALVLHAKGEQPLLAAGRLLGNILSGAYGDTAFLQTQWRDQLLGARDAKRAHRWYSAVAPARTPPPFCDYAPARVAYKLAVTGALLDDLGQISARVVLVLLPDVSLSQVDDPARVAAWNAHRAAHVELAATRPFVTLIDLSQGGAREPADFSDGTHLSRRGMTVQRQLFARELAAAGLP